jgi:hypothetical protein
MMEQSMLAEVSKVKLSAMMVKLLERELLLLSEAAYDGQLAFLLVEVRAAASLLWERWKVGE